MPEVSIIMPVYNKEKYMRNSLESVINQTFSDFELVVINDGSTDHSLDVIREYAAKDSRIKYYSQDNQGVSAARNLGLDLAQGEWIQFLDGDDLICKDYLTRCLPIAKMNNVDILFTDFLNINDNRDVLEKKTIAYTEKVIDRQELQKLFIQYQFETGYFGFISNKLIRHSLIIDCKNKFDQSLKLAEDLDFFCRLYEILKIGYIAHQISFQYLHNESNDFAKREIDYYSQIIVLNRIKESYLKDCENSKIKSKITNQTYYYLFNESIQSDNFEESVDKVLGNQEILDSLEYSGKNHFESMVIKAIKQRNKSRILLLLKLRRFLRGVYTVFKKEVLCQK